MSKPASYKAQTAVILWDVVREYWHIYDPILGDIGRLAQMDKVIELCEPVEICYAMANHIGYDEPFDFEFVPHFLREYLEKGNRDLCAIACSAEGCSAEVDAKDLFTLGQNLFEALLAVDVTEAKATELVGRFLSHLHVKGGTKAVLKVIDGAASHQEGK